MLTCVLESYKKKNPNGLRSFVDRQTPMEGKTAIMIAASVGDLEMVRLLSDWGAGYKLRDRYNRDVFWYAGCSSNGELANFLNGRIRVRNMLLGGMRSY